jgi:uncharacterized protein (UPF0332 family)
VMKWDDCRRKGLIQKDREAPARVTASLALARRFATSAENTLAIGEFEMAHIAAYNSAFHTGRALLFSHGFVERSHACLAVALRHFYRDDVFIEPFLGTFDKMRVSRHNVQYGGSLIRDEEAEFSCRFARTFCDAVDERLK